jgi:tripartite-type tricarboxylate transporter receptor subunit TctC
MIGMVVVRTKTGQFRNGLSRQSEREHKMSSPRYFVAVFLSCGIFAGIWPVSAQAQSLPASSDRNADATRQASYPTRPIRLIVPSAPGSTADALGRVVAQKLSESWGHQVVVDDRAGAAGIVGTAIAAKAMPDGYTLLVVAGTHAINPSLYSKLPYDTEKAFAPVTQVGAAPLLVVAHPSVPVTSIRQLIDLARSKPGQINYASAGKGTPSHLIMELFKSMAKVDLVHVAYNGGGPVLNAIVSGEVQVMASGVLILMPLVKAGKLKSLAVTGARRAQMAPDIPTVAESGVPGFAVTGWWGILAPAATPTAIVSRLQREIARLLLSPDTKDRLAKDGIETVGSSSADFAKFIHQEIETWTRVVKSSGASAD